MKGANEIVGLTQVQAQLQALDDALETRARHLETLRIALVDVTRSDPPVDVEKSSAVETSLVPLANSLRMIARQIRIDNRDLQSLTERLEL